MGAGKIGVAIADYLSKTGDFDVRVADVDQGALDRLGKTADVETLRLDASAPDALPSAMQGRDSVVSALSFTHNQAVAQAALEAGASYFDLTEDVQTTKKVMAVSKKARPGQIFMPQCGLAPGFVSIVAHDLTTRMDSLDTVTMRVGALPLYPSNALKYNLTWSTDGLINEYCNPCEAIHQGKMINVLPLEGLEHFSVDGVRYEAFNTSGGLGTLCETLDGKVRTLNYKTVRYQGHRDLAAFLVNELRLSHRRDILKDVLEYAVPMTDQDVVIVFCAVTGQSDGRLLQITDARKIYHAPINGREWSAIQITTAMGLCAVLDMHAQGQLPTQGFVRQEQVSLNDFLNNRFGRHYAGDDHVLVEPPEYDVQAADGPVSA
jgi:saccharopine dehydrogenase-like NADP-dependent oxidoreductase